MASVRDKLVRGGAIDTRDLMKMPDGRKVTIGGLVTVRQRPATAGGTIFLLLEDEWGYANIVVPKPLVAPNEEVVKRDPFVLVQGRVDERDAQSRIFHRRPNVRSHSGGVNLSPPPIGVNVSSLKTIRPSTLNRSTRTKSKSSDRRAATASICSKFLGFGCQGCGSGLCENTI